MADKLYLYTPTQNLQVDTGKGHLAGVIATSDSTTAGAVTIYDYAGAGPPSEKIFEVIVTAPMPVILLFNDRYAPRFQDGVWLISSDHVYVTMFVHIPTP
ncbi:MAG TPA: hypothetical protein VLD65_00560 [Anaerolineales bacterium]|nr:hypothetical protein [Anaerolineales bacterium]